MGSVGDRVRLAGRWRAWLFVVVVVLVCSLSPVFVLQMASADVGGLVGGTPSAPSAKPADAKLDEALRALVRMRGGPVGVVAIVQRGSEVRLHTAGVRDLRTRGPIRAFDHMRLASTAKAFSGAVVLSLVNRGVLSLADTIARRLPQLPAAWGAVTLRQLLNHTSGLPDYTASQGFYELLRRDPHATPTPRQLLRWVGHDGLRFRPGSQFRYSNSDNIVVALMAEAVTHRPYAQLLASIVYAPLGLKQTSLRPGFGLPSPYLHGYQLDPPKQPQDVSTYLSSAFAWASGGIVSTPGDLNRFIRAYAGARLFDRRIQAQQLQLVKGSSDPTGPGANMAGLAIFRYRTRCGTVYGHTGGHPFGYTQFMAATLDGKRSATVSVNLTLSQGQTGHQLIVFGRLRQAEEDAVCAALAR